MTVSKAASNAVAPAAKGDLVIGSGTNASTVLGVASTAGWVLTVDSATTTGLKWAAAAGGGFEGARASKNANQSLNSATATALTFQVEDFDSGGYFTTGSNTRMTIPSGKGGYYLVIAQVAYANSSTSNTSREAWLRVNGSDIRHQTYTIGMNMTRPQIAYAVDILSLSAADYVEVIGYQDTGGALNVINDLNDLSYFAIHYLGA